VQFEHAVKLVYDVFGKVYQTAIEEENILQLYV
jgi:hypothetical protein